MKTKKRKYEELKDSLKKMFMFNYYDKKNPIAETILKLCDNETLEPRIFISQVIDELNLMNDLNIEKLKNKIRYKHDFLKNIIREMMESELFEKATTYYDGIKYDYDQYGNKIYADLNPSQYEYILEKIKEDIHSPKFMEEKTDIERKRDLLQEIRFLIQNKPRSIKTLFSFFSSDKNVVKKQDYFLEKEDLLGTNNNNSSFEAIIFDAFINLRTHINNSNDFYFIEKIALAIIDSDLFPNITKAYNERKEQVFNYNQTNNEYTDFIGIEEYRNMIINAINEIERKKPEEINLTENYKTCN